MTLKEKFEEKKQKVKEFYEKHKLAVGFTIGSAVVLLGELVHHNIRGEEVIEDISFAPSTSWCIGRDDDQDCNFMDVIRRGGVATTNHGRKLKTGDITLGFIIDEKCKNELEEELSKLSFDSEEEDL